MKDIGMKWIDGTLPALPANKLEQLKAIKDGNVSFEAFASQEYMTVLGGMIHLSEGIPQDLKNGIIKSSIFSAAKLGKITQQSIEKEIKKQEAAYFKRPLQSLILVSSLSVFNFTKLPAIRSNGCSITFRTSIHHKYKTERQDIERRASEWIYRRKPRSYINFTARVKSRSETEAANFALDQIDLIRGIWNLLSTSSMRMSSGRTKPVNTILLGPVHTLHLPSKKLATEIFWYQPNYHDDIAPFKFGGKLEKTLSFTNRVRRQLRTHPYKHIIEEAIRRYVRALDYSDLGASFIKLWSVLEYLTNTLKNSYKVTVRRAAFVFDEVEFHRQVLNNLKTYRNSAVHSGEDPAGQIESYLYQLKRYVEQLIRFHLWVGVRFASFSDATLFLDSNPDVNKLRAQRKTIEAAIKYRSS